MKSIFPLLDCNLIILLTDVVESVDTEILRKDFWLMFEVIAKSPVRPLANRDLAYNYEW